jgi:Tfp pilus assembly protein PilF
MAMAKLTPAFVAVVAALALYVPAAPSQAQGDAEIAFHRGISAYGDGRLDDARKAFGQVLARDREDTDAMRYLGLIAQAQGRPKEAIAFYQSALELEPDNHDARFDLGTALLEAGRPDEARAAFEQVIAEEPDRARAHYFAGIAAYRVEQYDDAVAFMNRATELDPSLKAEASYYTGLAEAYQGNISQASVALDTVSQSAQSPLSDSAASMRDRLRAPTGPPRPWALSFTTGAEYDSNPTLAAEGMSEQEDARFVFRLRGHYDVWQNEKVAFRTGYDGYLGVHTSESQVDLQTHVAYASAGWNLDPVRLNLRYDFAYTMIDLTDELRILNRVTPTVTLRQQEWGLLQGFYQFSYADFESTDVIADLELQRDGPRHAFGFNQYVFLSGKAGPLEYLRFGAAGDFYDADSAEQTYRAYEVSGGFGLGLPFDTDLTALYRYVRRDYNGKTSLEVDPGDLPIPGGTTRRDDHISLIFLDLSKNVADHWIVSVSGNGNFNSSDVGVFDYNRFVVGGYVTYAF